MRFLVESLKNKLSPSSYDLDGLFVSLSKT